MGSTLSTKETDNVKPQRKRQGLALDDFLWGTEEMRQHFKLRTPKFGLKEIERHPGAREALERLIRATVDRHGSEIYSKPNSGLSEMGTGIYSEWINTGFYSGWRISPSWINRSLRKVLERALQTVAQLPARDAELGDSSRGLKLLASHFGKLADKTNGVLYKKEARDRIGEYFRQSGEGGLDRIERVADEMRWAAETLNTIVSGTRLVKYKMGSANPQVRFALYMAGWFEACTGRKQYELLSILITAAFYVAVKKIPKWVDRPAIEMFMQRRHRKRWFSKISS